MTSQLTRTCQLSKKLKKTASLSHHRLHSIVHLFLIKKWGCQPNATRQLLPARLRVPVCPLDGLLPHSDLHPSLPHRRHILGQLLVITTALAPKSPQNSEQQQNLCPATWKIKATFNELEKITFPVQVQTLSSCKVKWPNVHILRVIILGLFWRGKALAHLWPGWTGGRHQRGWCWAWPLCSPWPPSSPAPTPPFPRYPTSNRSTLT